MRRLVPWRLSKKLRNRKEGFALTPAAPNHHISALTQVFVPFYAVCGEMLYAMAPNAVAIRNDIEVRHPLHLALRLYKCISHGGIYRRYIPSFCRMQDFASTCDAKYVSKGGHH